MIEDRKEEMKKRWGPTDPPTPARLLPAACYGPPPGHLLPPLAA